MIEAGLPDVRIAEQGLIGSVIRYNDLDDLDDLMALLPTEQYLSGGLPRLLWRGILKLYENQQPINSTTVANELQKTGFDHPREEVVRVEDNGAGQFGLAELAEDIVRKYRLLELAKMAERISKELTRPGADPNKIQEQLEQHLLVDMSNHPGQDDPRHVGDLTTEFIAELKDGKTPGRDEYIETRIADLNQKIVGMFKGDMTVVAGPSSMGKTSFALDLMMYAGMFGTKTLYIVLDERTHAMMQRMFIGTTGIDRRKFLTRSGFTEADWEKLNEANEVLGGRDFWIDEKTDRSILDIRSLARRYKHKHDIDMIVIDYIGQIRPHRRFERHDLFITEVSRICKAIAKDLNLAMIVVSQMNRQYEESVNRWMNPLKNRWPRPQGGWLRDSGSILQDANLLLMPFRKIEALSKKYGEDHEYTVGELNHNPLRKDDDGNNIARIQNAEIIIGKNKMGPLGLIDCKFDPQAMRFYSESDAPEDATYSDYEDREDEF